ncbi:IS66 family insertion sequence element accessory protein TnpB [Phocaeicola dorei]|nr:IS66 family insertion sequence element accessory protein TnpB [Phocaeicola dorei]
MKTLKDSTFSIKPRRCLSECQSRHSVYGTMFHITFFTNGTSGSVPSDPKAGGPMLSVTGMNRFYYLRGFTDMRCKHSRVLSVIREQLHREPSDGDIYIVMSKDRRIVRLFAYDNRSYSLFEKKFVAGYQFMRIIKDDEGNEVAYRIDWKDVVLLLESPVIKSLKIR